MKIKKRIALFLISMFVLAVIAPSAMAACPKAAKTCSTGSCTTGNCYKSTYSQPCTKDLCIVYMKCKANEYIQIKNGKSTVQNLKGYTLTISCNGCSTKSYKIPCSINVKPGKSAYVFTCTGRNSGPNCYMGVCGDVLKCSGMTVTLKNPSGKIVSTIKN